MNKKNILIYLFMMLPALLLTSCLKDQEDKFDQSASKRLTEYMNNAKKVLTSAENGWVLNYYPDREQSYGGYVYTLKFDDQMVEAGFELAADPSKTIKSTYTLCNESGPAILFDTYNEYLHYFTTPSGSSGAGGYEAYDGDHMLIIMGISEDGNTITLKGARSGNIMYMHKLTEDPATYLKKIYDSSDNMIFSIFNGPEGSNLSLEVDNANRWAYLTNEETKESVESAFIVTADGIDFFAPVELDGNKITGLKYDAANATFTTVGDKNITFTAVVPPINEDMFGGADWYLGISNLCPSVAETWELAAAILKAQEGETLGFWAIEGDVLYMQSGNYAMGYQLGVELIGEDQVKLAVIGYGGNATQQGNASYYTNSVAGFPSFYSFLDGTFKLEYANTKRSLIKLTNVADPSIWFIVSKSAVAPY